MTNFEQPNDNDWELPAGEAERMIRKEMEKLLDSIEQGIKEEKESLKEVKNLHQRTIDIFHRWDEVREEARELRRKLLGAGSPEKERVLKEKLQKLQKKEQELQRYLNKATEKIDKNKEEYEELQKELDKLEDRVGSILSILKSSPQSN